MNANKYPYLMMNHQDTNEQDSDSTRRFSFRNSSMIVNIGLSVFMWFLFLTDYSLPGNLADLIFPLAAGAAAWILPINREKLSAAEKVISKIARFSAIIGAGLFILSMAISILPPFTFGTLLYIYELADETEIQRSQSPDNARTAIVYFRGVGPYASGNGRIFVRVRHQYFPLLERDVYYLGASYVIDHSKDYLEWTDNNHIYIFETEEEIEIGIIKPEIPRIVIVPYIFVSYLIESAGQGIRDYGPLSIVRNLPLYEGKITHDQSQVLDESKNVFRSYNIHEAGIHTVFDWYQKALSEPPWEIDQINQFTITEHGIVHVRYCIQASRTIDGVSRVYFWEFMGAEGRDLPIHVNIGSLIPVTDACERFYQSP